MELSELALASLPDAEAARRRQLAAANPIEVQVAPEWEAQWEAQQQARGWGGQEAPSFARMVSGGLAAKGPSLEEAYAVGRCSPASSGSGWPAATSSAGSPRASPSGPMPMRSSPSHLPATPSCGGSSPTIFLPPAAHLGAWDASSPPIHPTNGSGDESGASLLRGRGEEGAPTRLSSQPMPTPVIGFAVPPTGAERSELRMAATAVDATAVDDTRSGGTVKRRPKQQTLFSNSGARPRG